MHSEDLSRRSLLQAIAAMISATALPLGWTEIAQAISQAHAAPQAARDRTISFVSAADAADIEAVAAQIIPSDSTPGAREAGVVYFIDRALATFFRTSPVTFARSFPPFIAIAASVTQGSSRSQTCRVDRQIEWLRTIEHTPFFQSMRRLTVLGMFTMPAYGGNRDGLGWKLMGFVDQHRVRAAVRLLRPRLSRVRGRPGQANERSHISGFRARRLCRGGLGRGGWRRSRANWRRPDSPSCCSSRAPDCRRRQFEHDELKYWYLGGITNDSLKNPQTFRSDPAQKAELVEDKPPLWYGAPSVAAALHFTANYWRFHEIDFNERSVLGAIPGTGFDDWPITYAELEPYYTKVEWEIGVSGSRRRESFRAAAHEAISDATAASEVVRRAARARRTQAGSASVPCADGDQFASRTAGAAPACTAASATDSRVR